MINVIIHLNHEENMNLSDKKWIVLGIILIAGLLAVALITFSTFSNSTYEVEINGISFQMPLDLLEVTDDSSCAIEGVESRTFFHIWDWSYLTISVSNESKINNSLYSNSTPKKIRGFEGFYHEIVPDSGFVFESEITSIFEFDLDNKTVRYQTSKPNYEEIFNKVTPKKP